MEGQETEVVVETPQRESAATYLNLLNDKTAPAPVVQETVETPVVETPVVATPEVKVPETTIDKGNISLEDEPTVIAPTDAPVVDDFDKKYLERITKEFGADVDTIKAKLIAPAQSTYKTAIAKLADEMEVGTKMSQADFFTYVATDHKALPQIELLDLKLRLEDPNLTAEDRAAILEDKYKTFPDATPQEIAIGKYKMGQDHKAALAEFEANKAKLVDAVQQPTVDTAKVNADIEAKQAFWKTEAPNVMKIFDKLPVTLKVQDPKDPTKQVELPINFDIPKKDREILQAFVEKNGSKLGLETKEQMADYIRGQFIQHNYTKLIQKSVEVALSDNNEKWTLKLANYTPPKGKTPTPKGQEKSGSAKEYLTLMGIN